VSVATRPIVADDLDDRSAFYTSGSALFSCATRLPAHRKARSRVLQMPYGDQGIFVHKQTFHELGGFAMLPIMEDFEFVRRLRRRGRIRIVSLPVTTSGRRWQELGPWRTTWINQKVILGYYLGVSPERLAVWYGGLAK